MMTTLNDFISVDGLFKHIYTHKQDLPFFGIDQSATMDNLLMLNYGDRLLYQKLTAFNIAQISEMIVNQYGSKWGALVEIDELNKLSAKTRVVTETTTNNETRNNSRDDKNLISAYNDDALIVNDGSTSTGSDDLTGMETRTLKDETIDLKTAYNNLSLSSKNNIIDTVMKDVVDFLTLSSY